MSALFEYFKFQATHDSFNSNNLVTTVQNMIMYKLLFMLLQCKQGMFVGTYSGLVLAYNKLKIDLLSFLYQECRNL